MEKRYIIYESELHELIRDSLMLAALESGGLNRLQWYKDSISDFIENYRENRKSFDETIDKEIEDNYDTV